MKTKKKKKKKKKKRIKLLSNQFKWLKIFNQYKYLAVKKMQ